MGKRMMLRVAVIGAGYWGPNLIRNFSDCPLTRLVAVCDQDPERLEQVTGQHASVDAVKNASQVFDRPDIDAVAIATPITTHAPLGRAALAAGKHVLVEKPLAHSVAAARELIAAAQDSGRTLMVDHTYVFSPAVQLMKQLVDGGELGQPYFIDSVRINLGLFQTDTNVVWDLAPHDLSIVDYLMGVLPSRVSAFGACNADTSQGFEDIAHLNLDFEDGFTASFHVNWLSPVKIRHFIIGGSKKSIVYNDLEPTEKIKVYDRGITITRDPTLRRGMLVDYRIGDVHSPHVGQSEPLQNAVSHFARCALEHQEPLTDGQAGLRVVQILEAAQQSIKAGGRWIAPQQGHAGRSETVSKRPRGG